MEKRNVAPCRLLRPRSLVRLGFWCASLGLAGCGAFNPAFVSILDPSGSSATLDNAPGHVIISFVNNVTYNARLLDYLLGKGGVTLSEEQLAKLHPLIRTTISVGFSDQTTLQLQVITGSPDVVEAGFPPPVLNDNETIDPEVFNRVVTCGAQSVTLQTIQTEVFIPVEITGYELIQTTNDAGNVTGNDFEPRTRTAPVFRALQIDDVDENFNVVLQRNVDIDEVPTPIVNQNLCGGVVGIVLTGELSVPFLERNGSAVSDAPSYDQNDAATIAGIGGRYSFEVGTIP